MSTPPRDMREWMRQVERKLAQAIRSGNSSVVSAMQAELGKVRDEIIATTPDSRIAARPVELVSGSSIYFDGLRKARGRITLTFAPVTKATDGTDILIDRYELWGRDETGKTPAQLGSIPFTLLATAGTNTVGHSPVEPESTWRIKVRATSQTSPLPGEFSTESVITVGKDTVPPPIPSALVTSAKLGVGFLEFNGLAANGAAQPSDYSHTEVALGTASSPTSLLLDVFTGAGRMNLPWMAYGTYFVRARSVDTSGNVSAWSANSTLTISPLVTGDISGLDTTLQSQVDRAEAAEDAAEASAAQALASKQAADAAKAAADASAGTASAAQQAALDSAAEAAAAQAEADAARAAADAAEAASVTAQGEATQAAADAAQALADMQENLTRSGKIIRQETAPTGDDRSPNNLWIKDSTGESYTWDTTANGGAGAWELVNNTVYATAAQQADAAADRAEAAEAAANAAEAEALASKTAAEAAQSTAAGLAATAQAAEASAAAAVLVANAADAKADAAEVSALSALGVAAGKGRVWTQSAQPPTGRTYEWAGTANNSESIAKDNGVEVRRNKVLNPSFEGGTNTWTASGLTSGTVSTEWARSGTRSYKATAVGSNTGDIRMGGSNATTFPPGIQPGKTYTMSCYTNLPSGVSTMMGRSRRILFFFSTNGSGYTEMFGPQGSNKAGVERIKHTFTVPANSTGIVLGIGVANGNGLVTYAEDVLIEEGSVLGDYFDGSTPDDREYDLWIDTTGGANTPKRWNTTSHTWTAVTDKAVTDASAAAIAARNDANAAAASALTAQGEATTAKNTAVTAQQNAAASQTAAQAAEARADAAEASAIAAQEAADQSMQDLAAYLGTSGRVIYQEAEPTGEDRSANNLWIRPSDGKSFVYDTGSDTWDEVVNTAVAQAALDADAAADRALAAQQAAQTANTAAEAAQAAAQAAEANADDLTLAAQQSATAAQQAESRAITAENAATAARGDANTAMADVVTLMETAGRVIYQEAMPTGDDRNPNNLWIKDSTGEVFAYDTAQAKWVLVESQKIIDAALQADAAADRAEAAEAASVTAKNEATTAKTQATTAQTAASNAATAAANSKTAADQAAARANTAEANALAAQQAAESSFDDLQGFLNDSGKVMYQEAMPTGDDRNPNNLWIKPSDGTVWTWNAALQTPAWVKVTDQRIIDAALSADAAQEAAEAAAAEALASKNAADVAKGQATTAQGAASAAQAEAEAAATAANQSQAQADAAAQAAAQSAADAAAAEAAADEAAQAAGSSSAEAILAKQAAEAAQGAADQAILDVADIAKTKGRVYAQGTAPAYDPNGLWIDTANGNVAHRPAGRRVLYRADGGGASFGGTMANMAGEGWDVTTVTESINLALFEAGGYDVLVLDGGYAAVTQKTAAKDIFEAGYSVITTGNDTTSLPPMFSGTLSRSTETANLITPIGDHPIAQGWPAFSETDLKLTLAGIHTSSVIFSETLVGGVARPEGIALVDPVTGARWVHKQTYAGAATIPYQLKKNIADWVGARWIPVQDAAIQAAASAAAAALEAAQEAHGAAGGAQDTADAALNAASHAGKNLFSPDVPSGTAPYGTIWIQHDTTGKALGHWQQTGGSAPNPTTGLGGVDGSTWTARPVTSQMIDNVDVTKLTGLYIDAKHIQASTLTIGGTTLGAKVANLDSTGKLPTASLSGTVSNAQVASGLDPSKLTGAGTVPESKIPTLTEAKIPTLTEAKIPTLSQSKVSGLSTIASNASAAKAKTDAAIGADNVVLTTAIPTLDQSKVSGLVAQLSTMDAATAAARKAATEAMANAVNVIVDPSFENGTWVQGTRVVEDTAEKRSGTKSLKVVGGGNTTTTLLDAFPVQSGQTWRFAVWYKTTADYNGTSSWGKFRLGRDPGSTQTASPVWSANRPTWTLQEIEYVCPDGIQHVTLQIGTDHTVGTIWFDDVAAQNITDAKKAQVAAATAQAQADAAMLSSAYSKNPTFEDWTGTTPDGWSVWSGYTPIKDATNIRVGAQSVRMPINASGTQGGMQMNSSVVAHMPYQKYVTVEVEFMLTSGTIPGAGVIIDWSGRTGGNRQTINFNTAALFPNGVELNKWHRVTATLADPSTGGTFTSMAGYLMANWSSFGAAVKSITYDWFNLRPATQQEIDALLGKAKIDAVTDANGKVAGAQVSGTVPNATSAGSATNATNVTGSIGSGVSVPGGQVSGTVPVAAVPTIPQSKVENLPSAVLALNAIEVRQAQWTYTGTTFIDGGSIHTDSITTLQLQANAVTAEIIAAGAIGASEIDVDALWADTAWLDVIRASSLTLESNLNGYRSVVSGAGINVFRDQTNDDGTISSIPVVSFGAGADNSFATYDPTGEGQALAAIESDGGIVGQELNVVNDPMFMGRPLIGGLNTFEPAYSVEELSWMDASPRGLVAFTDQVITNRTTTDEYELGELFYEHDPLRTYQYDVEPFTIFLSPGSWGFVNFYYTTNDTSPTMASPKMRRFMYRNLTPNTVAFAAGGSIYHIDSAGTTPYTMRILVTLGAQSGSVYTHTTNPGATLRFWIHDIGPRLADTGRARSKNRNAPADPAPTPPPEPVKKTYTSTWVGDWMASYYNGGSSRQVTGQGSNMLKQGRDPYWPGGGIQTSLFGITSGADSGETGKSVTGAITSGATVNSAKLRLWGAYDPTGSSGRVRVYWHTLTSAPGSFNTGTLIGEYTLSNGGSLEINLPASVRAAIKAGTLKGFGFHPAGSTDSKYILGISWSTKPRLTVNYSR